MVPNGWGSKLLISGAPVPAAVDGQSPTIIGWRGNNHVEKYEFVNGKNYPIHEMDNKPCLKPPTRLAIALS
jgi:hypothetical protein